jgi:hypothetical protein
MLFLEDGQLFDPSFVGSVVIRDPDSTIVSTSTPSRVSMGTYATTFSVPSDAELGTWMHTWNWRALATMNLATQNYDFYVILDQQEAHFITVRTSSVVTRR